MYVLPVFFIELFILFLLSRTLQRRLSQVFFLLTHSQKITVYLMAFCFLPGTFIHEMAHALMAQLLFVPVGHMELWPKLEGQSIKLGSVAIAKTDPLRRILIGVAPFLIGTAVIITTLFVTESQSLWENPWIVILIVAVLFEIGNSMFSSNKDLEGASFIIILVIIISVLSYILGFRPTLSDVQSVINDDIVRIFYQGAIYLAIPLILDVLLITLLTLSLRLLRR